MNEPGGFESDGLTERQQRERDFHKEYAALSFDLDDPPDLESVDGPRSGERRRPWNSYWYATERLIEEFDRRDGRARLLDFGCGPGYFSVLFSHIGYEVDGFDISEESLEFAEKFVERYGYPERTRLKLGVAEKLEFEDSTFDVIAGIDILHHVDIPLALRECYRTLKPGGVAIFKEPVEAPLFDRFRNSSMVTSVVPNTADFDVYITEDERKLNADDLQAMTDVFPSVDIQHFRVTTRLTQFGRVSERLAWMDRLLARGDMLDRTDRFLLKALPFTKRLAGEMVVTMRKDPGTTNGNAQQ